MLALATATVTAGPAAGSRVDILSAEINSNPEEQQLYLRRALAWADSGQNDKAMADVNHAEQLGDPLQATLVRGILWFRQDQLEPARTCFDAFLDRYPDHPGALGYRARLLRSSGDNAGALADYQQLIALQPAQDPGIYLATAQLLAAEPDLQIPEALALLDRRITEVGAIPQLQRYAIRLEKQRGNYSAALRRLSTLDDSIRATPQWHVETAELLLLSGHPAQAQSHLLVATEQLQNLRPTPARAVTREKAATLLEQANNLPIQK
ncbi:tetratricopeptide repeat protein [Pseudohalioglobus lutimaris]|uniref:Uncharacterized protein n=1 Tax=Pseudohalioglobus lutimaris TaxID=1737061 RepID=A0A2N5X6T7_9GAMM|nr:hypothetical protein [Pseudohalioglobus lutimaris]PLW70197.1 hypothetical protein C0039_03035 [Pseudohalioglobus lutimaris]